MVQNLTASSVDADARSALLTTAVRAGHREVWEAVRRLYLAADAADERERTLRALASAPGQVADTLDWGLGPDVRAQVTCHGGVLQTSGVQGGGRGGEDGRVSRRSSPHGRACVARVRGFGSSALLALTRPATQRTLTASFVAASVCNPLAGPGHRYSHSSPVSPRHARPGLGLAGPEVEGGVRQAGR